MLKTPKVFAQGTFSPTFSTLLNNRKRKYGNLTIHDQRVNYKITPTVRSKKIGATIPKNKYTYHKINTSEPHRGEQWKM